MHEVVLAVICDLCLDGSESGPRDPWDPPSFCKCTAHTSTTDPIPFIVNSRDFFFDNTVSGYFSMLSTLESLSKKMSVK